MSQFDWLIAAFPSTVFTVFDTETTGLEPKNCRVVEAGGIRFDARGINSRFNVLINPGAPMPAEVTKINGITDSMLKGQPDAAKVMPDFLRFIGDSVLIAHNAPFDVNFINSELSRLSLPPLRNRVIDTRIFAKEMFPGLPKYALQDLALHFGIQALDAHRAEDDARVCMELFLICIEELRKRNPHAAQKTQPDGAQPLGSARTDASIPVSGTEQNNETNDDDDFEEEDLFDENLE